MYPSPPPPPTCFPHVPGMESCFTRPSRGIDEVFSFRKSAFSTSPCQESRPEKTLFEASGSFTDLSSWSVGSGGGGEDAEDRFGAASHAGSAGLAVQSFVLSRGSALHDIGKCKPCAFLHRPIGCANGALCVFCHLCAPGEKKRRQRSKLEAVRLRRELRRAAISAGSADVSGGRKSADDHRAAA